MARNPISMQPIVRPKQCVRRAYRAPAPPAPPCIMASEALALVSGAGGGGSAPPPTSPVLTCETCEVRSDHRAWAQYTVRKKGGHIISKTPTGTACLQCVEACIESQRPEERPYGDVIKDEEEKVMVDEYAQRLRGKPSLFYKASMTEDITYHATWEDVYTPVPVSTLRSERPDADQLIGRHGWQVFSLVDTLGTEQQVVLVPTGEPAKVRIIASQGISHQTHRLRPDTHVRQAQGAEWLEKSRGQFMKRHPNGKTVPRDMHELTSAMGSGDTPACAGSSGAEVAAGEEGETEEVVMAAGVANPGEGSRPPPLAGGGRAPRGRGGKDRGRGGRGRVGRRLLRRTSSAGSSVGGGKRSQVGRKRGLPQGAAAVPEDDITVESILAEAHAKPKVLIYHRAQRLPTLERTCDAHTVMTEQKTLEQCRSAEQLVSAAGVMPKPDLHGHIKLVLEAVAGHRWPLGPCRSLIRRRVRERLESPSDIFACVWPFLTEKEYDPYEPRCADISMAPGFGPLEKLHLARGHIFKDWLATLGEKDVGSRSAILEFNGLLRQAPVPTSLDSACAAVLQEIRGPWNAVTALVQTTGATAEQVIDMSALAWDDPRTDADRVIVDLCKRAWWKQQKANMWGAAARESIALPIIERVTTTLLDHAASRDEQDAAWRSLESKADRWLQGDVRAGALDDMWLKLSRYVTDAAAQAASKPASSEDVPWLQSLGLRARWISQRLSASIAQTTSLGPVIDQIALLTANARLSQAMSEMQALTQQDEDQELDAQATMTLLASLGDCDGLQCAPADAPKVVAVARRVMSGADVGAARVDLADKLFKLLSPDDATKHDGTINQRLPCTRAAWALIDTASEASRHDGADVCMRARVVEAMRAAQKYPPETSQALLPTSVEAARAAAMRELEAWQARVWENLSAAAAQRLEAAVRELREVSGGGRDGGSWKARLSDDSAWGTVRQEAEYHLLAETPGTQSRRSLLDERYAKATESMRAYEDQLVESHLADEKGLVADGKQALELARETGLEWDLAQTLIQTRQDKRSRALQKQVARVAKYGIDLDRLCSTLWQRAQESLSQ